ncbi:uncharacterized protein [Argopecten irradians]|uniref:uncharacterized protein n=1 Tax=Argopecten irradians TaxID=31199 RepID=UPI0037129338
MLFITHNTGKVFIVKSLNAPSFESGWLTLTAQADAGSQLIIPHDLNEYPVKVDVQVRVIDGGDYYIFTGTGSAHRDDDDDSLYGGVVYIYNTIDVRVYAPDGKGTNFASTTGLVAFTGGAERTGSTLIGGSYKSGEVKVRAWKLCDIGSPAFDHQWTAISGSSAYHEITHNLGVYPDLVTVQIDLDNTDYMSDAQGSAGISDPVSGLNTGGVLFGYDTSRIRLWASSSGYVFSARDGWGLNENWWFSSGTFRIMCWIFPSSETLFQHTLAMGIGLNSSYEIPFSSTFDTSAILVSAEITVSNGNNPGFRFYGVGNGLTDGSFAAFGGVVYVYTENQVLLWRPSDSSSGKMVYHNTLWAGGQMNQMSDAAQVTIRVMTAYGTVTGACGHGSCNATMDPVVSVACTCNPNWTGSDCKTGESFLFCLFRLMISLDFCVIIWVAMKKSTFTSINSTTFSIDLTTTSATTPTTTTANPHIATTTKSTTSSDPPTATAKSTTTSDPPTTTISTTTSETPTTTIQTTTSETPTTTISTTTSETPTTTISTTTSETPTTTISTTTNEKPATTISTTTSEKPLTTISATTSEKPATTLSTTTSEKPATTISTTTNEKPATTISTTTSKKPLTTISATTSEKPATTLSTTTSEKPATTISTTTSEKPVTTISTTNSEKPVTILSTTTSEKPATTKSITTNESPTTTMSTTNSETPTTTISTITSETPTTAISTTTSDPPSTTISTTTSDPPTTIQTTDLRSTLSTTKTTQSATATTTTIATITIQSTTEGSALTNGSVLAFASESTTSKPSTTTSNMYTTNQPTVYSTSTYTISTTSQHPTTVALSITTVTQSPAVSSPVLTTNSIAAITPTITTSNTALTTVTGSACGPPIAVTHTNFLYEGTSHRSRLLYSCDSGFTMTSGDQIHTCSGGVWTGTSPVCSACQNTYKPVLTTPEDLTERLEVLKKNIEIDAKNTSSYKRSLTCANDQRPSAISLGIVGVIILMSVCLVLVLVDAINLYKQFHSSRTHVHCYDPE